MEFITHKHLKKFGFGAMILFFFFFTSLFYTPLCRSPSDSFPIVIPEIQNFSTWKSDVIEIKGDIRIHGLSSTIFVAQISPQQQDHTKIRPYARKGDNFIKKYVKQWKIKQMKPKSLPDCSDRSSITPAVVFSTGGYAGNHFHDFTDLLIPLYITSREYNGNILFLISDKRSTWISKYELTLQKLSNFGTLEVDNENRVLCFAKLIIGLKAHKEFGIDPHQPPYYSINDFIRFLRTTYSLERDTVAYCEKRPKMLIISRRDNRFINNEKQVASIAETIGFDVTIAETGWNISIVAKFVNSFDVMIGIHGAGLTNMVFMPENGVVIQIIPFGAQLWACPYFSLPAKDMKLNYLEYNVSLNESSLQGMYSEDSEIYRDPEAIYRKGFIYFHSVYLKNQNVTLDLSRFKGSLEKAMELIKAN